jgi:hypothetical protein
MPGIDRESDQDTIAVTNSTSTTGRIDLQRWAGGGYIVDSLATGVTITWHVSTSLTGTTFALKDRSNVAVTQSVTDDTAYPIPDECYGFPFAVPVLNAGSATLYACPKG